MPILINVLFARSSLCFLFMTTGSLNVDWPLNNRLFGLTSDSLVFLMKPRYAYFQAVSAKLAHTFGCVTCLYRHPLHLSMSLTASILKYEALAFCSEGSIRFYDDIYKFDGLNFMLNAHTVTANNGQVSSNKEIKSRCHHYMYLIEEHLILSHSVWNRQLECLHTTLFRPYWCLFECIYFSVYL